MNNKCTVKIAAVQDAPVFLDKKATIEKACGLITKAAAGGASLALFPEAFVSGYPDWVWTVPPSNKKLISSLFSALYDSAVSVPDDATAKLCKAAKEAGIYVVMGINERNTESSDSSLCNSMIYISPRGEILGVHRKLIPTGGERLMWSRGDGSTLHSFDTEFGRIGGLICWENFMPLARFAMYSAGVRIYLAPTWDSSDSWTTAMRHIAREGGMYVAGCAMALHRDNIPDKYEFKALYPEDKEWINKGNSVIVNPRGEIIAGPLNSAQGILYADLDMEMIRDQKWLFDVAGHYHRPDVFRFEVR